MNESIAEHISSVNRSMDCTSLHVAITRKNIVCVP